MNQREFIVGLGGAAAWPLAARAQQQALPAIGFVNSNSAEASADRVRAFRNGLSETRYVDPRNVIIEYRWLEGQYDRLPARYGYRGDREGSVASCEAIHSKVSVSWLHRSRARKKSGCTPNGTLLAFL
jgi:putative ABC transport system substrate-binding protein